LLRISLADIIESFTPANLTITITLNKQMKIELNLILYKLTIALKRRRKLLTTQQCANRLGLRKQTLYRLKKLGKLKTHGYALTGATNQKTDLYDWHEVKESYHHD